MGFIVVVISETCDDYSLSKQAPFSMHNQSNYICLSRGCADEDVSKGRGPETTNRMMELAVWWCKSNNGKYPSRALGLGTLKEQQIHYNNVYNDEREVVSPDLRVQFDYGSANKSHALATTLGKIIPIFYPGVTFSEYGCVVLQAGSGNYMKVREDGSGVTEIDTDELRFEFKGPIYITEKKHTANVHFTIHVHFSTQISCQMPVKHC